MRLPPHVREPFFSSIPAPDTSRRGLCFSQVMPFSYVSQRNKQPGKNGTVRFDAIARRRACSTLARVARVSRLIGNSDSTGKAYQWQVCALGGSVFGNRSPKAVPNTGNATQPASGVSLLPALVTGPRQMESGGCLHHSFYGLPGRLFPFEGRSLAVALPGYPVLLWLAHLFLSGRYITGAHLIAIRGPFSTLFIFNGLHRWIPVIFCILEALISKSFQNM
jgi:hypothetical protein